MCDRYRDGKCISRYCHYLSAGGTCLNPKMKPKPTNADKIRGMSDEELAELLSQIAYARYTPWAEPFSRTFCDDCPVTTVKIEGYYREMDLHECDFTDGKCPYGSDIVYWLQQPAETEGTE